MGVSLGSAKSPTGPQAVVCKLLDDIAPIINGMDPLEIDVAHGHALATSLASEKAPDLSFTDRNHCNVVRQRICSAAPSE